MTNGFNAGDVFALNQPYDAIQSDLFGDTFDAASTAFFLRGPDSESPGAIAAFAVYDPDFDQRTVFVMFPYVGLPIEVQSTLLTNILAWFGLDNG